MFLLALKGCTHLWDYLIVAVKWTLPGNYSLIIDFLYFNLSCIHILCHSIIMLYISTEVILVLTVYVFGRKLGTNFQNLLMILQNFWTPCEYHAQFLSLSAHLSCVFTFEFHFHNSVYSGMFLTGSVYFSLSCILISFFLVVFLYFVYCNCC